MVKAPLCGSGYESSILFRHPIFMTARSVNPFRWPLNRRAKRTPEEHNRFILQTVQPALAGLMDGSVSTLAPIFAAAFATRNPHIAFVVGLSAAVGAAISMAFAEGLSDDGRLTGRGHPFRRGVIIGIMTFLGGIFHTVPFLMADLDVALITAYLVVGIELMAIAYIRYRYFQMRFWLSVLQVIVGGGLVFLAGILIGES